MAASLPAVLYGALYYRNIDRDKTNALKDSKGNFDKSMSISAKGIRELEWWYNHLDNSFSHITRAIIIDEVIYSDASLKGWGAAFGSQKTGGNWSCTEATSHINILELKAALFALGSFRSQLSHKHVKIMIDNSAAVYMINKMGSSHTEIGNDMVVAICEFCINNEIWLTAAHVPGSLNVIADAESRRLYTDAEWMLKPSLLHDALSNLGFKPDIDLFASRLNKKFEKYCSYKPDPGALHIDAFSISWNRTNICCFPPFSCILQVLQKIIQEKAEGILVVPNWATQPWFPLLEQVLVKQPILLPPSKQTLVLPARPTEIHPLHQKLELKICLVSGHRWNP